MEQFDIRNTMFDEKEMEKIHSAMRGKTIRGYRWPMLTLDKLNWCIDPTYLGVKTKKVPSNQNIICLRECENVLSNLLSTMRTVLDTSFKWSLALAKLSLTS